MENKTKLPSPLPKDLKVTVQNFSKIFPDVKSKEKYMFLSNIDIAANFETGIINFFDANPLFWPEKVAHNILITVQRLLMVYDVLAGRLKPHPESGRLVVECNSGWTGFAFASSELSLAQLGNLSHPNEAFRQLALPLDEISPPHDRALSALQVTSFKCGGFALGISINHLVLDGISSRVFLENAASIFADKPLALTPYDNRQLLAARSPPRVTFSHKELFEISLPEGQEIDKTVLMKIFQDVGENLENKILQLSEEDITKLREKAIKGLRKSPKDDVDYKIITRFNVIMAHLWRCKALSENENENEDDDDINMEKTSTILYAADLRSRMIPPLPLSYTGNAIISAYATATIGDLKEKPFHYLVKLISEGAKRVTDEYARSHIDWLELHKGFPHGDFFVSSWWKLGLADVNYPWGRPRYTFPLLHFRKNLILLLPQVDNEGVVTDKGVNVFVALPSAEMDKFQQLFHSSTIFNSNSRL